MYENLKRVVKALDSIKEVGEDVMEDGKIDFTDLGQATRLISPVQEIVEAFDVEVLKVELLAFLDEKLEELKA